MSHSGIFGHSLSKAAQKRKLTLVARRSPTTKLLFPKRENPIFDCRCRPSCLMYSQCWVWLSELDVRFSFHWWQGRSYSTELSWVSGKGQMSALYQLNALCLFNQVALHFLPCCSWTSLRTLFFSLCFIFLSTPCLLTLCYVLNWGSLSLQSCNCVQNSQTPLCKEELYLDSWVTCFAAADLLLS